MAKRLFSHDPVTGLTRWWRHNPMDDTAYIETVQDIGDTLDANKAQYNDAERGWQGGMHKIADIPMPVYFDLKKRGILDDEQRFAAWLNDPANRHFRTKPGKV